MKGGVRMHPVKKRHSLLFIQKGGFWLLALIDRHLDHERRETRLYRDRLFFANCNQGDWK